MVVIDGCVWRQAAPFWLSTERTRHQEGAAAAARRPRFRPSHPPPPKRELCVSTARTHTASSGSKVRPFPSSSSCCTHHSFGARASPHTRAGDRYARRRLFFVRSNLKREREIVVLLRVCVNCARAHPPPPSFPPPSLCLPLDMANLRTHTPSPVPSSFSTCPPPLSSSSSCTSPLFLAAPFPPILGATAIGSTCICRVRACVRVFLGRACLCAGVHAPPAHAPKPYRRNAASCDPRAAAAGFLSLSLEFSVAFCRLILGKKRRAHAPCEHT